MASTIAKVTVSFGLVSIPVKVSAAARAEGISFNMLHTCSSRIKQKTWCPACDKEISRTDTVKGYEIEKGRYLIFNPEELDECKPESSKVMEIGAVVKAEEVDPLLFESSYYLEPEPAGKKGYKLLLSALEKQNRVAVATITLSQREHTIVLRPCRGVLVFHTMYYHDEVRQAPALDDDVKISKAELDLACQLLDAQAEAFDHRQYHDGYRKALETLIEEKQSQKTRSMPKRKAERPKPSTDILAQMAESIKAARSRKKAA